MLFSLSVILSIPSSSQLANAGIPYELIKKHKIKMGIASTKVIEEKTTHINVIAHKNDATMFKSVPPINVKNRKNKLPIDKIAIIGAKIILISIL